MTSRIKSYKRLAASLGLAAILTTAVAAPALAYDAEMEFTLHGGDRSIDVTALAFADGELTYSHVAQSVGLSAPATMTASDATGSDAGWEVVATSTGLVQVDELGDPVLGGASIAAANIKLTSDNVAAGDSTTGTDGVTAAAVDVSPAGDGVTVFEATAGNGDGTYTATLDVEIDIEARQAVGTYAGDLVLTISAPIGD